MSITDPKHADDYVNEHYRKVAARWRERVTDSPFMQQLRAGTLPLDALRTFFKNWGSYTIEINTVEAASYHKHIAFFRKHRDLMARMAEKLADELIHPKPPGHVHVVVETAKALDIGEEEIFLAPMLAEFRAKLDFKRSLLWEGTMAEFYAAGATEARESACAHCWSARPQFEECRFGNSIEYAGCDYRGIGFREIYPAARCSIPGIGNRKEATARRHYEHGILGSR